MSSSFFKGFYIVFISILFVSCLIIIFFIPALSADSNFSFNYTTPNISSIDSNIESKKMNENSEFIWPTPRIFNNIIKIW